MSVRVWCVPVLYSSLCVHAFMPHEILDDAGIGVSAGGVRCALAVAHCKTTATHPRIRTGGPQRPDRHVIMPCWPTCHVSERTGPELIAEGWEARNDGARARAPPKGGAADVRRLCTVEDFGPFHLEL